MDYARAPGSRHGAVAVAMREGGCSQAQEHVVTKALDELPNDIDAEGWAGVRAAVVAAPSAAMLYDGPLGSVY